LIPPAIEHMCAGSLAFIGFLKLIDGFGLRLRERSSGQWNCNH
jgi:hypothetical protein